MAGTGELRPEITHNTSKAFYPSVCAQAQPCKTSWRSQVRTTFCSCAAARHAQKLHTTPQKHSILQFVRRPNLAKRHVKLCSCAAARHAQAPMLPAATDIPRTACCNRISNLISRPCATPAQAHTPNGAPVHNADCACLCNLSRCFRLWPHPPRTPTAPAPALPPPVNCS